MPRMSELQKKSKLGALKKMGSFFNPFAPSPDKEETDGEVKKPSISAQVCEQEDCVNRDGSPCSEEQKKERCKSRE